MIRQQDASTSTLPVHLGNVVKHVSSTVVASFSCTQSEAERTSRAVATMTLDAASRLERRMVKMRNNVTIVEFSSDGYQN